MSLEISEINVRLSVGTPPAPAVPQGRAPGPSAPTTPATLSPKQFEEIVNAAARAVIEALRMAEGR